jgi:hypothetical protein
LTSEGLFNNSPVTPAVRLNDASDIWSSVGSTYKSEPSRPFRSANISRARAFSDLGLYSMTFYNQTAIDGEALDCYATFREEAEALDMCHFLEVFAPAFDINLVGGVGDVPSRIPPRGWVCEFGLSLGNHRR